MKTLQIAVIGLLSLGWITSQVSAFSKIVSYGGDNNYKKRGYSCWVDQGTGPTRRMIIYVALDPKTEQAVGLSLGRNSDDYSSWPWVSSKEIAGIPCSNDGNSHYRLYSEGLACVDQNDIVKDSFAFAADSGSCKAGPYYVIRDFIDRREILKYNDRQTQLRLDLERTAQQLKQAELRKVQEEINKQANPFK